jgi:hypothetical protein
MRLTRAARAKSEELLCARALIYVLISPDVDEREQNRRRKARADVDKWAHDLYDPKQQQPRTKQELVKKYGSVRS